jgi:cytosylglucuronate decarboxylase
MAAITGPTVSTVSAPRGFVEVTKGRADRVTRRPDNPLCPAALYVGHSVVPEKGMSLSTTISPRPRYLFIRLLEACNAGCFMCGFANSRDKYRFTNEDLRALLPSAGSAGVRYVRFTGGEPLMHREILANVRTCAEEGFKVSLITNGWHLPRMVENLAEAGLGEVVVSIDGTDAAGHDAVRRLPGLFDRAVEGVRRAVEHGISVRVNTVVGPHNYTEIPALQRRLAELRIDRWELSALKLRDMPVYPDLDDVRRVGDLVYSSSPRPMGKRWYGDTAQEQERYFAGGVPPRATGPQCETARDVLYLDAKAGMVFPCSCLPHRADGSATGAPLVIGGRPDLQSPQIQQQIDYFAEHGPSRCTGCSATAAGYSDAARDRTAPADWLY